MTLKVRSELTGNAVKCKREWTLERVTEAEYAGGNS